jgi:hypothetical protein
MLGVMPALGMLTVVITAVYRRDLVIVDDCGDDRCDPVIEAVGE